MKCKKDKFYTHLKIDIDSIELREQELLLNFSKEDRKIYVHCTWYSYILKLLRNPLFTLQEGLEGTSGKIIQVKGYLLLSAVRFKSKLPILLSLEAKKQLRERLLKNRKV